MRKIWKNTLTISALTLILSLSGAPAVAQAQEASPAFAAEYTVALPAGNPPLPADVSAPESAPSALPSAPLPGSTPSALPSAPLPGDAALPGTTAAPAVPAPSPVSLQGKKLSILGDSLSTFTGTMPADYNLFYPTGEVNRPDLTWWGQTLTLTGMTLCSNASSANTNITGNSLDMGGSAPGCSFRRIMDLRGKDGSAPDVILVQMGINDFSRSRTIGSYNGPKMHTEGEIMTFTDAYDMMMQKIRALYPSASIYCCTLLERVPFGDESGIPAVNLNGNTVADYNKQIKKIAAAYGAPVIDLYNCGINYTNLNLFTLDGIHPTVIGGNVVAQTVVQALLK